MPLRMNKILPCNASGANGVKNIEAETLVSRSYYAVLSQEKF